MTNLMLKKPDYNNEDITFANDDLFGREELGKSLKNLIQNSSNQSLTISIDANWGEGKTHFLKMWKNYLESYNFSVIYFNAFENDYIDDPFIPIFGELYNNLGSLDDLKDKGVNVIKSIIPYLGKVSSRWLLRSDDEQNEEDLQNLINSEIEAYVKNTLDSYLEKEKEIKKFKYLLNQKITEEGQLIFIVDELDRCKPDFALKLLERIKHFFDIDGLYFVLGINKNQIIRYIENIYGSIDAEDYLQKFIDIETVLKKKVGDNIENDDLENYVNYLIDNYYIDIFRYFREKNGFKDFLSGICREFAFSLREVEKLLNYISIYYKSISDNNNMKSAVKIIIFFIVIKLKDINLYKRIKFGYSKQNEFSKFFNLLSIKNEYNKEIIDLEQFIYAYNLSDELIKKFSYLGNNFDEINDINCRRNILNKHLDILDSFNN